MNCAEARNSDIEKEKLLLMGGGNPYPLNENYFFELGCHQNRFNPLCMECMEERADKSDLSWNEVLELIWEQPEENTNNDTGNMKTVTVTKKEQLNKPKIRFWTQYSFRHDPFLTFTAEKSNYQEAVKFRSKLHTGKFSKWIGNDY